MIHPEPSKPSIRGAILPSIHSPPGQSTKSSLSADEHASMIHVVVVDQSWLAGWLPIVPGYRDWTTSKLVSTSFQAFVSFPCVLLVTKSWLFCSCFKLLICMLFGFSHTARSDSDQRWWIRSWPVDTVLLCVRPSLFNVKQPEPREDHHNDSTHLPLGSCPHGEETKERRRRQNLEMKNIMMMIGVVVGVFSHCPLDLVAIGQRREDTSASFGFS